MFRLPTLIAEREPDGWWVTMLSYHRPAVTDTFNVPGPHEALLAAAERFGIDDYAYKIRGE